MGSSIDKRDRRGGLKAKRYEGAVGNCIVMHIVAAQKTWIAKRKDSHKFAIHARDES